jgi:hypothetical protein
MVVQATISGGIVLQDTVNVVYHALIAPIPARTVAEIIPMRVAVGLVFSPTMADGSYLS